MGGQITPPFAALLDAISRRGPLTPLLGGQGIYDNPAVIAALVDAGADLKARTEDGLTPLHWAARATDNPAVIAALVDAGADLKARTENGLTPWDYAKDREPLKRSDAY